MTNDDPNNLAKIEPPTVPQPVAEAVPTSSQPSSQPSSPLAEPSYDLSPTPQPVPSAVIEEPVAASKPKAAPTPVPVGEKRPFVTSSRYDWPLIVAGCAAVLFVAACLAGQQGLFPQFTEQAVEVGWSSRLLLMFRGLLMMPLGATCLIAGAYLFHIVDRRPLGDLRVLSSRMLMVASLVLLVRIFPIGIPFLKQTYDVLVPIAAAWLLLMPTFRLPPRDAGLVVGAAILTLVMIGFGSSIVSFVIWAGTTAGSAAGA